MGAVLPRRPHGAGLRRSRTSGWGTTGSCRPGPALGLGSSAADLLDERTVERLRDVLRSLAARRSFSDRASRIVDGLRGLAGGPRLGAAAVRGLPPTPPRPVPRGSRGRPVGRRAPCGLAQRPDDPGDSLTAGRGPARGPPRLAGSHPRARRPHPPRGADEAGDVGTLRWDRGRTGVGGLDHGRARRDEGRAVSRRLLAAGERELLRRAGAPATASRVVQERQRPITTARSRPRATCLTGRPTAEVSGLPKQLAAAGPLETRSGPRSAGCPGATSRVNGRPSTVAISSGGRPPAGRIERTFSRTTSSPARTSCDDVQRPAEAQALPLGLGRPDRRGPGACQAGRSASTTSAAELGRARGRSAESTPPSSGPGSRASRRRPRRAPRPPRRRRCPAVWSERPTGTPKRLAQHRDVAQVGRPRGRPGRTRCRPAATSSVQPASRAASTAASISPTVAMPVEMIIGLPVRATSRISGRSTISDEAILYSRASSFSSSSTAVGSNGLENGSQAPCSRARSKIGSCHSHGVCASLVELVEVRAAPQLVALGDAERRAVGRRS